MIDYNTYVGDVTWAPTGLPEPKTPPNDLWTTSEPWAGALYLLDAFLAKYAVGQKYTPGDPSSLGTGVGYIIDNTPRNGSPGPGAAMVELVVAMGADFSTGTYLPRLEASIATTTVSVSGFTGTVPGLDASDDINLERQIEYYCPETDYQYYAASKPTGTRFNTGTAMMQPRIIRSVIKATGGTPSQTVIFAGEDAPSGVVSATTVTTGWKLVNPTADPVAGTPWFKCTERWRLEYLGDSA